MTPPPDPALRGSWLRASSDVAWRVLVVLAAVIAILLILARLQIVFVPVFIALLITCALAPPTRWLERKQVPTGLATALVFVVGLGAVAGVVSAIVPPIVDEFSNLGPTLSEAGNDIEDWLVTGPLELKRKEVRDYRDDLGNRVGDLVAGSSDGVVQGARTVLELLAGLVLSLVLSFFFVKDARVFQRWGLTKIPVARREFARTASAKALRTLGNYLVGAATIGFLEAVVIGVAVALAGGRLVVPVMVLTFAAAFFPIVGAIVAGIVAVMVTFVSSGLTPAIIVLIVVILVQQFDTDLLAPLIYGRAVRLHPVVVLVALTAGGTIAGIVGAFVAVPITAVASTVGAEVWKRRTGPDVRFSTDVPEIDGPAPEDEPAGG